MSSNKSLSWIMSDAIWRVIMHVVPTKLYLTLKYRVIFGASINWKNPKTYSEKLQWLKLYGYKPEYSDYVDKIKVKSFVASTIGEEYVIPTLGIWDSGSDIDFTNLPEKFVLKCNHDSGAVIICSDKRQLNEDSARLAMNKQLKTNYYLKGRETPYKFVKKQVFAEQYIHDKATDELIDYKFYCFDGVPRLLLIATDRKTDVKFDFFDMDFNHLNIKRGHENATKMIDQPKNFGLMKDIASRLSTGIPHVRVDLYEANGKVYFGEMTFYPSSGFTPFEPGDWEYKLGEWITLPNK
ncbi:MAG: glycosyl transferase [Bacteroidales bacterium]|nr:glycosyl transferase [Bacteroidales bacterium]